MLVHVALGARGKCFFHKTHFVCTKLISNVVRILLWYQIINHDSCQFCS